jgi:hypothetical protein
VGVYAIDGRAACFEEHVPDGFLEAEDLLLGDSPSVASRKLELWARATMMRLVADEETMRGALMAMHANAERKL